MRTTTLRRAPVAAVTAGLLLSVAACTSPAADSGTDEPAGAETQNTQEADAPADDEPAAGDAENAPTEEAGAGQDAAGDVLGLVTVDDVQYEITELRNCEPLQQEMVERELELQGLGEHDGERIQIDVYIEELAGAPYNDVAWSGPEGVFGTQESADVTLDAGGTSVRGVATLQGALTQTETVTIDFDLPVPAETIACR